MRRNLLIAAVAVLVGIAAAVVASSYLGDARTKIAAESEPIKVLVAQRDLKQGMSAEELITKGYVKLEAVPRRFVPEDALSSDRMIQNRVLGVSVTAGEQLTDSKFIFPTGAGLAYNVPDDLVAISVKVDEVSGVGGMIKPGDTVTLFANYKPENNLAKARTATVLPRARVLAVGSTMNAPDVTQPAEGGGGELLSGGSSDGAMYKTVTLAVSPKDAASVAFAQANADIQLALLAQTAPESTPPYAVFFSKNTARTVEE